MGKLVFKGVAKNISKLRGFRKKSLEMANKKFLKEKDNLLRDFDRHAVTAELKAGPDSLNVSGTLPGGYGNLFSFIGFNRGEDPTEIVREALERTKINKTPKKGFSTNKVWYSFTVKYPTLDALKRVTPMPWETGLSWLDRVEHGISGFGYYMNTSWPTGRSGKGAQIDHKIRQGGYSSVSYYSGIINRFKKGMKRRK